MTARGLFHRGRRGHGGYFQGPAQGLCQPLGAAQNRGLTLPVWCWAWREPHVPTCSLWGTAGSSKPSFCAEPAGKAFPGLNADCKRKEVRGLLNGKRGNKQGKRVMLVSVTPQQLPRAPAAALRRDQSCLPAALPALPGQLSRALPRGASLEKGEGGSGPTPRQEQRPGGGAESRGMSSRDRETGRVPGSRPGSVEDSDGEGGIVSPFSFSSHWQKAL